MKKSVALSAKTILVASAAVLGTVVGGAAVAVAAPTIFAPAGVASSPDGTPAPVTAPNYASNDAGQTYGSALDATSPDNEPDLIMVDASNGKTGYAKKTDLAAAEGTGFTSIDEAVKWSEGEGQKDHIVPVYLSDGKTQIGEFTVYGSKGTVENGTDVAPASK